MAGLPWIKVWTALPNHPKVQRLEKQLCITDALGIVVRLWCWTAAYAPEGEILESDIDGMAAACKAGKVTRDVTRALVTAGFLEPISGGFRVHDWRDMQTVHVEAQERRKAQARERQARFRAKQSVTGVRDVTRDVTRDSVTEKEKEKEITTTAPHNGAAPAKTKKPSRDPSLDALEADLSQAYRDAKHEDLDWPGSAHGELQAIRKALGSDDEVRRRWIAFLGAKFWPTKNVHFFREAFQNEQFRKPPQPESPWPKGIPHAES